MDLIFKPITDRFSQRESESDFEKRTSHYGHSISNRAEEVLGMMKSAAVERAYSDAEDIPYEVRERDEENDFTRIYDK